MWYYIIYVFVEFYRKNKYYFVYIYINIIVYSINCSKYFCKLSCVLYYLYKEWLNLIFIYVIWYEIILGSVCFINRKVVYKKCNKLF